MTPAGPAPADENGAPSAVGLDERRLRLLLEIGQSVVAELDLEVVLAKVLGAARELTGARYAAVGVMAPDRRSLERFVTSGIDPEAHARIGDLPRGRGILGLLIDEPYPLRLADVGAHPRSYGFPLDHPPMATFLGVPVVIAGRAWGNLYLTEKDGGEFDEQDEAAIVILAAWAARRSPMPACTRPSRAGVTPWNAPCAPSRQRPRSRVRSAARRSSTECSS